MKKRVDSLIAQLDILVAEAEAELATEKTWVLEDVFASVGRAAMVDVETELL